MSDSSQKKRRDHVKKRLEYPDCSRASGLLIAVSIEHGVIEMNEIKQVSLGTRASLDCVAFTVCESLPGTRAQQATAIGGAAGVVAASV